MILLFIPMWIIVSNSADCEAIQACILMNFVCLLSTDVWMAACIAG